MPSRPWRRALLGALVLVVLVPSSAAAAATLDDPSDQWLPSRPDASWTYRWTDAQYVPATTTETYTVAANTGPAFRLAWTTEGQGNGDQAVDSAGQIDYQRSDAGLVNLNWSSTPPPPQLPILCASASGCPNSLASTHYLLIWGNRSPVLLEPLVQGARWSSVGGGGNDVASSSRYLGRRRVTVPAFPKGLDAAVVEAEITQAGALGDPYGSGIRTVWWVRGVGPVKITFRHTGGDVTDSELAATNLAPRPAPADESYLPLDRGGHQRFRYSNTKHLRRAVTQDFTIPTVVNGSARVDVKETKGDIRVAGSYLFASRLSGVTNLSASTQAASLATFPPLGPRSAPADRRRHFFTAYDLMVYGFNPILPAYPARGQTWRSSKSSRDYKVFGVTGTSKIVGTRRVTTPAGTFKALVVESRLRQAGFPYGSGTRTSWFAPGVGLVKLVFRHGDGSVSTVARLR